MALAFHFLGPPQLILENIPVSVQSTVHCGTPGLYSRE